MHMPELLTEYYEGLRTLRDQALEASRLRGHRHKVGNLVFGKASAGWVSERGCQATLRQAGLEIRRTPIPSHANTVLTLFESVNEHIYPMEVTAFVVDFSDIGYTAVLKMCAERSLDLRALNAKIELTKNGIIRPDHAEPSDQQRLRTELARGATGAHPLLRAANYTA